VDLMAPKRAVSIYRVHDQKALHKNSTISDTSFHLTSRAKKRASTVPSAIRQVAGGVSKSGPRTTVKATKKDNAPLDPVDSHASKTRPSHVSIPSKLLECGHWSNYVPHGWSEPTCYYPTCMTKELVDHLSQ
ncbi:hypothetical protein PFISCL1PPCAC_27856, partial [Pristionchus fissidentatus]